MGWIKRNLFFVVGGVITLLMLGAAGFYIYKGWSGNSDATATLNELYSRLQQINQEPQQPGNDKIDNMGTAKDQEKQARDWIKRAVTYFQPVPPIPPGPVTSKTFATALNSTIYHLQQEAKENSVNLPNQANQPGQPNQQSQYYFSFQVQSTKLTISSGLGPLAEQLGQIKAISETLFAARINDLIGIQRVPVSDDDSGASSQSDYIAESPVTNDLAIITPYVITFQTFTPELAKVITGFATSTNPFIIKSISVQPASGMPMTPDMANNQNMNDAGRNMVTGQYLPGQYTPGQYPPGQYPPAMAPTGGKGGLQTVLKEQLLRITMEVEIVKLLPKS